MMMQGKASAMDQPGLGHGLHKESFVLCDKIKVKMTSLDGPHLARLLFARQGGRDCRTVAHVLLKHTYIHIYRYTKWHFLKDQSLFGNWGVFE